MDWQQENGQLEGRYDYGNRHSRVRGSTVWHNNNWPGTYRGAVVQTYPRPQHRGVADRRSEAGVDLQRQCGYGNDGNVCTGYDGSDGRENASDNQADGRKEQAVS